MNKHIQQTLAFALIFLANNSVWAQPSRSAVVPSDLYHKAWRLIKDSYYDQKFGGQDWSRWEHRFDNQLKTTEDAYKAIKTMLTSLPPPGADFIPRESFDSDAPRKSGVGLQLGTDSSKRIVVIDLDRPTITSGIQLGNEIVAIDNKPAFGLTAEQLMRQLEGPLFTKVEITVRQKGGTKKATLKRAPAEAPQTVSFDALDNNVGYIRIQSFMDTKIIDQLKNALIRCHSTKGIIIDLRSNGGGLLHSAIELPGFFLKRGLPLLTTLDADNYKTTQFASNLDPITNTPLVVLIDENTARAAEIIASALQGNGRAIICGVPSAGNTFVTAINKLEDGSGINITIARWIAADGSDLEGKGIKPNILVPLTKADLRSGKGPWWKSSDLKASPSYTQDKQLKSALEVLSK